MRQSWEIMTSASAGYIILTPTQPVGSGRPQRESNPGPPHQESRGLPTELPRPLRQRAATAGIEPRTSSLYPLSYRASVSKQWWWFLSRYVLFALWEKSWGQLCMSELKRYCMYLGIVVPYLGTCFTWDQSVRMTSRYTQQAIKCMGKDKDWHVSFSKPWDNRSWWTGSVKI